MTTSITTDSSAYSATTISSEWEEIPCVQYGYPSEIGPTRSPKLQTIFEPIPDGANTASPVYLLTPDQYERQDRFETGYEIKGGSSIASEIQDECEAKDRVLYPIHIESDQYKEEGPETLINWFKQFVTESLALSFHDCSFYFSGNRSIHVHVPRFVHGENQLKQLGTQAKEFCEESGANLDVSIYSRKGLFRLPGVVHHSSILPKVEIEPEWKHERIIREAAKTNSELPASYAEVLRNVFAHRGGVTREIAQSMTESPHALFRWLDMERAKLEFSSKERETETPLIERVGDYPDDPSDVPEWARYNDSVFSPYALASGNGRSVASVKVKGAPFARKRVTIGNSSRPAHALIPAYFYGAHGCAGDEFTKIAMHAPLQLSKQDYEKWDFDVGDNVVIIGGQSRSSRILKVKSWEAKAVHYALVKEGGGREAALDLLSDQGYDVGASGSKGTTTSRDGETSHDTGTIWSTRQNPQSSAEELQRIAEQEGIDTLSFPEVSQIAHRHLLQGWKPTLEWFEEQYGSQFDAGKTWTHLQSIVAGDRYEEYDHIEVPEKPV